MSGSISQLIDLAQNGNDSALGKLQQRYWPRLVRIARRKMSRWPERETDSEDIAQCAFISVCESLSLGKVPQIRDRNHFLAFLSHVVACQVVNEFKRRTACKRGGGRSPTDLQIDAAPGRSQLSPIQSLILKESYQSAMAALPERLQTCAQLHLSGLSNREVAEELNCTQRTVERKLAVIRMHWQDMADGSLATDVNQLLDNTGP